MTHGSRGRATFCRPSAGDPAPCVPDRLAPGPRAWRRARWLLQRPAWLLLACVLHRRRSYLAQWSLRRTAGRRCATALKGREDPPRWGQQRGAGGAARSTARSSIRSARLGCRASAEYGRVTSSPRVSPTIRGPPRRVRGVTEDVGGRAAPSPPRSRSWPSCAESTAPRATTPLCTAPPGCRCRPRAAGGCDDLVTTRSARAGTGRRWARSVKARELVVAGQLAEMAGRDRGEQQQDEAPGRRVKRWRSVHGLRLGLRVRLGRCCARSEVVASPWLRDRPDFACQAQIEPVRPDSSRPPRSQAAMARG
jgi:hypothetical protein